jgi:DNA-binding CsgD family transcriptional regulator
VPAFVEEAEALMQEDLDGYPRALLRIILACAAIEESDLDSAVAQLEESLVLCRELGDLRNTSMSFFILGLVEFKRGDLDRGTGLLKEGAYIMRELKEGFGGAYHVWGLGKVNALRGKPVQAARLWGAADALREQMGMSLSRFDLTTSGYEQDLAAVRSALDEASFDAAWAEGRAMSSEQAFEYAFSEEEEKPASAPATKTTSEPSVSSSYPAGLSAREAEVLKLVADGLTNVRIAEALFISPRTVDRHLNSVYQKIGVSSRAAATRFAIEHGLA